MEFTKKVPVAVMAESKIAELIRSGKYEADMKLPTENDLCLMLGVGRGSVREAVRSLQAKGMVEIKPGRGAFVAETPSSAASAVMWLVQNEADLRDFIEIRNALEPLAAKKMAENGTEEQILALTKIHNNFLIAVREGDIMRIAALDEAFHSAIVAGSGNALLVNIDAQLSVSLHAFRSHTFSVEQNTLNAIEPHSRILEAIIRHQGEMAHQEMLNHLHLIERDLSLNISSVK